MQQETETMAAIPARMNKAWNNGDATAFAADFAADAEFVAFEGTVLRGREQINAFHQPLFDTVLQGSRLVEEETIFARIVARSTDSPSRTAPEPSQPSPGLRRTGVA